MRALREARRLSVRELSAELESIGYRLIPSGVSKIENGDRGVTVSDLLALAAALQVTPSDLLVNLDAKEVHITPTLTVTPVEALWWMRGLRPLPGQTGAVSGRQPAVEPAAELAKLLAVAREWDTTSVLRAGQDQQKYDEATRIVEAQRTLARSRLASSAHLLVEMGVELPATVADYLAEHPDAAGEGRS